MQNHKVKYICIKFIYSFSILFFIIVILPQFVDKLFKLLNQEAVPSGNSVLVSSISSTLDVRFLKLFLTNIKRIIFFM